MIHHDFAIRHHFAVVDHAPDMTLQSASFRRGIGKSTSLVILDVHAFFSADGLAEERLPEVSDTIDGCGAFESFKRWWLII